MWDSTGRTFIDLTLEPLSIKTISNLVSDPEAGATSVFVGTTRNNFQGKAVIKLEYEAYKPMAVESMRVSAEANERVCDSCVAAVLSRYGD
jgi:molybdopterin synthase catalytic subunit